MLFLGLTAFAFKPSNLSHFLDTPGYILHPPELKRLFYNTLHPSIPICSLPNLASYLGSLCLS